MAERTPPAKTRIAHLLIDGEWRAGGGGAWRDIVNPLNEQVIGKLAVATADDLDDALAAAQRGFERWRATPAHARADLLQEAAAILRERIDEEAARMTLEQGKPVGEARVELIKCAEMFSWCAEEGRRVYGRIIPNREPGIIQSTLREPIGPVAAFTPWNFPASQAARKIAASVATGCSIIVKGPEEAPSGCIALAQALIDAGLPPGVVNLVFGVPAEISARLIPSPIIRKVSFTGSVPVGKQLAKLAAEHMKPCTMELGGHAPVIVFDDVDIDRMVPKMVAGKFRNAGQVCISPTRFYVQDNVYERTLEAFVQATEALKVGDGLDPETRMGPLANPRRRDAIAGLVDEAVSVGARIATGGRRRGNLGNFYEPTVLTDVPETARIRHDEPFGPVALFAPFASRHEVLARANDTEFGLASYVFTRSAANADYVARELRSGMVSINNFGLGNPETPFGGVKDSGYGREGGAEALDSYLVSKFVSHELQ